MKQSFDSYLHNKRGFIIQSQVQAVEKPGEYNTSEIPSTKC